MSSIPRSRTSLCLWLVLASGLLAPRTIAHDGESDRPKLVILITVDQLRGDQLTRFEDRFEGGFKTLLEGGLLYTNAHYPYATTFTAVGHATLATGATPIDHGIVGNVWFDAASRQPMYCVQDAEHGRSPCNLTSTTLGDELILATAGAARAYSLSLKDRAAILPGGRYGSAFWYDSRSGQFVSSSYYSDPKPAWLGEFNAEDRAGKWVDRQWTLQRHPESYLFAAQDDRPFETGGSLGNVFPHPLGSQPKDVYGRIPSTPFGDRLLAELAQKLIVSQHLGQGSSPDFLAISFSATDSVGHKFGPNSLEAEDNLLWLDRTIGELLRTVDDQVGLDHTLVALSADHGVDAVPAHRLEMLPDHHGPNGDAAPSGDDPCEVAGRLVGEEMRKAANAHLRQALGVDRDVILAIKDPGFYLDPTDIDVAAAERELAAWSMKQPGIARAFTRTDLLAGDVPSDPVARRVACSFHPERSANVFIVQKQGWYLYESAGGYAAMHGSPYSYDTHVPIVIFGAGVAEGRSARPVTPQDIAPTLANRLGILAPSGCSGEVLIEAIPSGK